MPFVRRTSHRSRRTGHPSVWFAVLVMLFQVALATDHGTALAVSAVGAVEADAAGLLALCHGDGTLAARPSDDGRPADRGDTSCVLCASAAVAGAAQLPFAPIVAVAPIGLDVAPSEAVPAGLSPGPTLRYGVVRGPPGLLPV